MVFPQYEPFHEVSNATVLQKISHNDCMCKVFLQYGHDNVSLENWFVQKIYHNDCMCMAFLQYGHDNVSLESCPPNMISHICYRKKVVFLSE